MSIKIGEVIGVHGIKVTLKVFEESNRETLFYQGAKYKGVSIREYISIRRGFRDIICIIEGEYLVYCLKNKCSVKSSMLAR